MDLSTDLVRSFLALCETRSFSKAARKLYRSQSALSTQIASLEDRAGLKLFDRSERPLKLTEAGERFQMFALEFSSKIDELDRMMKELASGVMGEVRIAASRSVGTYLLADLVAEMVIDSPQLKVTLWTQGRQQVCEAVRRADQDFGIIFTDKPPDGLIGKSVAKEPLCFVISTKHPLATYKALTPRQVRSTPFIVGFEGDEWTDMLNRMLERNGIYNFPVALTVNNYKATKDAVRAGLGIAILPKFTVRQELADGTLCQLNVRNIRMDGMVMIIERRQQTVSPAIAAVKALLETRISNSAP